MWGCHEKCGPGQKVDNVRVQNMDRPCEMWAGHVFATIQQLSQVIFFQAESIMDNDDDAFINRVA